MKRPTKNRTRTIIIAFLIIAILVFFIVTAGLFGFFAIDIWQKIPQISQPKFPYKVIWDFDPHDPIVSSPITDGTRIYLQTEKYVFALDGSDGKKLWVSSIPGKGMPGSQFAVSNQVVIIANPNGQVTAFSADRGTQLWRYVPILRKGSLIDLGSHDVASIMVKDQTVFIARTSADLTAFRLQDGNRLWTIGVADRSPLYLAANSTTVFISADHAVDAIDRQTGQVLWSRDFGANLIGPLVLEDSNLYIWGDQSVQAMDINLGRLIWSQNWASRHSGYYHNMILHGDTIYIGGDSLFAFSKSDGTLLWQSKMTGEFGIPAILDDHIFVKDDESRLIMVNAKTGNVEGYLSFFWDSFWISSLTTSYRDPVVAGNQLVVPIGSSRIKAYMP